METEQNADTVAPDCQHERFWEKGKWRCRLCSTTWDDSLEWAEELPSAPPRNENGMMQGVWPAPAGTATVDMEAQHIDGSEETE